VPAGTGTVVVAVLEAPAALDDGGFDELVRDAARVGLLNDRYGV
jgi:hypothetical protein